MTYLFNRCVVMMMLVVAGWAGPMISHANAQGNNQQQIRQLRSELARVRTQISVIESDHRASLTTVAKAIDRVTRLNKVSELLNLLSYLNPPAKLAKYSAEVATSVTRLREIIKNAQNVRDLWAASETTLSQLTALRDQINRSRLDAITPWMNKQYQLIDRLRALGVSNP